MFGGCGQHERAGRSGEERRGDIPRGKGEGMHEEFPVELPGARLATTATITATGARDGQWQGWGGISLTASHWREALFLCPLYYIKTIKMSHCPTARVTSNVLSTHPAVA